MQTDHERDRQEWKKIDKEKDELIDEMEKSLIHPIKIDD